MSIKFKGLTASLALATSMVAANGPATADTLASLQLKWDPEQCELKQTRRVLALDLEIPENLDGLTEMFCECEVVSVQMLDRIRKDRYFELILDRTSQECPGFTRALTNVATASVPGAPAPNTDTDLAGGDTPPSDSGQAGGGDNGGGNGGGGNGGGDNGGGNGGGGNGGGDNGGGDNGGGDNGGGGGDHGWDHDHDWGHGDGGWGHGGHGHGGNGGHGGGHEKDC